MVYVKYIKRGGKKYGPYYYKSIRDKNGEIKNIYVGKVKKEKKVKKVNYEQLVFIFFMILSIFALYYIEDKSITGFVTLQKDNEIINLRTENTRFINNSDGTQTAIINTVPMFSKEDNFKDIENKIKVENLNGQSIDNGLYKAFFSNSLKNSIKFEAYENYLNYRLTNLILDNQEFDVNDVNGVVDNTKVTYSNAFDNIDLQYEAQLKQLKENFIIKNPIQVNDSLTIKGIIEVPDWQNIVVYDASIKYDDDSVEITKSKEKTFTLQNSKKRHERLGKNYKELNLNNKQFSNLDNKNIKYIESNEIDFLNKNKETLFYIKEPYARDANNEIIKLNYTILLNNSKIYLILKIPGEWLKDKKYPIVIDPTDVLDDPWSSASGKDTIIANNDYVNGSSGGATFLYVGNDSKIAYRTLIQFDLSSLPNTASVTGALLKLYYYGQDGSTLSNISVYRLTTSWTEGSDSNVSINATSAGATWNQYSYNSNPSLNIWSTAGGDYDNSEIARTQLNATADNTYVEWDITTLVRNLGAGNHTKLYDNYGVILIANNEAVTNGKYFYSSDYGTVHLRPKLEVTYFIGSEAPSVTIFAVNQSTNGNGNITINYTVKDTQNNTICNLSNFQYSTDGGSTWYVANNIYGNKSNVYANDTEYAYNFSVIWSSKTDLNDVANSNIKFKFKANDSVNLGAYGTSVAFTVDNKIPILTNGFLDDGIGKNVSDANSIVRIGAYTSDDNPNVIKYELGNNVSDYSNPGANLSSIVNNAVNSHNYTGLTLNVNDILYYRITVNDTYGNVNSIIGNKTILNKTPYFTTLPNRSVAEDTMPTDNWIDLWDYVVDDKDNASELNFSIGYQSNFSLINCSIAGDRYVNCSLPAVNMSGISDVRINITDTSFNNGTGVTTVNVTAINDLPWWNHTIANQTIWEDEPLNISNITLKYYAYDVEYDLLYFEIVEENLSAVDCGITNITSGNLTLTPYANFTGSVNCTIRVNDTEAGGLTNVTIDVLSINDLPYWIQFNITAKHDSGLNSTYNLGDYAKDVETSNTSLIFTVVDENTSQVNCGINVDTDHLDFTPANGYYSNLFNSNCTIQAQDADNGATNYTILFNISDITPSVQLNSPANKSTSYNGAVTFNCSASDVDGDLLNITFYNDLDGVWGPKYGVNVSGSNNQSTYSVSNIIDNTNVKWNCRVYDTINVFNFYPENWTFNVSLKNKPVVQLIHPLNGSIWGISNLVNFTYNVTSEINNNISNCSLIVNNEINVTDTNITKTINQTFTITLPNAVYNWSVNCTDNVSIEGNSTTWNLTVNYTVPTVTTPSAGGGGGGGYRKVRERIASLEIIVPSIISILPTDTTIVPITFRNNGDVDLNGITLDSESNAKNLSMKLDKDTIPFLRVGQYENVDLILSSYELAQGRYTVKVMAKVDNPQLSKYTTFYLDVVLELLIQESVIKSKIDFAKDFFNKNKECNIFNNMIIQAEEYFYSKKYAEASSTIDLALQSCRDLLASKEKAKKFELNWWLIGIIIILFILIIFITYRIYKLTQKGKKEIPIIKEGKIIPREVELRYDELQQINNLLYRLEYLIDTRDFRNAEILYNDIIRLYDKLNNKDKKKIYSRILSLHKKALQNIYRF